MGNLHCAKNGLVCTGMGSELRDGLDAFIMASFPHASSKLPATTASNISKHILVQKHLNGIE